MNTQNQKLPTRLGVVKVLTSIVVALFLTVGLYASPSIAAEPAMHANYVSSTATTNAALANVRSSINPYGCASLVSFSYRQMYVAAFTLGFCPSVYLLQGTSWGRSFINWIVNGQCRIPWVVWAATGGRYTTC
jgi:hypothetical protein